MRLSVSDYAGMLNAIDRAIGNGVLIVEHNGVRTTYRSLTELRLARGDIEAQMALAGGRTPIRQYYLTSTKGL